MMASTRLKNTALLRVTDQRFDVFLFNLPALGVSGQFIQFAGHHPEVAAD